MKMLLGCAAVAALLIPATAANAARDYVWGAGSSTVFPFATRVAEQYARKTSSKAPKIESLGTGGGIKLFCSGMGDGFPDIANASRPMKKSEFDACAAKGVKDIVQIKVGFDGIVVATDKDVVIIAQIESPAGVKNIESIVACKPGIDGVIVGRSDLASALGHAGQTENPAVIEATHVIIEACKRNSVPSGIGLYAPHEATKWIDAGCGLFFYSADSALLLNAAKGAFDGFRAALAPRQQQAAE